MKRVIIPIVWVVVAGLLVGVCQADRAKVIGTVTDVRSGAAVAVHPVSLQQGPTVLARTLTDRIGKFSLDFAYTGDTPLTIATGSTTGYLPTEGAVTANTEVAIKVMPRWATLLGIVTDRETARGLADIPVQAGRGDKPLPDNWAKVTTNATGVFMLKVPAFEGDDVTQPVQDLWLSINEGDAGSTAHAAVVTDAIALWAWPDPTQPTKLEVSLPAADATGLNIEDVLSITVPDALKEQLSRAATPTPPVPPAPLGPDTVPTLTSPAPTTETSGASEFIWTCPETGRRYRITIEPID